MSTVLVTGVAGFLGSYVAREFAENGWHVIGIDRVPATQFRGDARIAYECLPLPSARLANVLQRALPETCVHCAGSAWVGASLSDPETDFQQGPVLTFALLDALRRYAPRCRVLFLSSAAVYGDPPKLPVTEMHPIAPLSPYGYHKRQSELLCEEFARIYGLPTASVRIFSAYGPGLRRQVVWDICERVLTSGALSMRGTGRESRDFIHAADISRALLLLAARAAGEGEIYNLATGVETTIAELAAALIAELRLKVEARFDGQVTPGDPLNWRADVSRLSAFGFAPQTALADGLSAVAAWSKAELSR
jgi:UDP-glucose 4-epimerase